MTDIPKAPQPQTGHYGWGLSAFIAAVAGTLGFGLGMWALADSFCLFECTPAQQQQAGTGLLIVMLSCPALVGAIGVGIRANRIRAGRSWAQAAICLAAIPVILSLLLVLLLLPMF